MRRAIRSAAPVRQRKDELAAFGSPIAGWVSNRALAQPADGPQGAAVLENFFPTATGAVLRRGSQVYVQASETDPVRAIFKYVVGNNRKLFCAVGSLIYDISTILNPVNFVIGQGDVTLGEPGEYDIGDFALSSNNIVWSGAIGSDWHVVQFATTGGIFLVGVNGSSVGFLYDGSTFYPNVPGGVWSLSYDGGTADFSAGDTLTGGTSGATATILKVIPSTVSGEGTLQLTGIAGTFEDDEAITDGSGGAAVANGSASSLIAGVTFADGITTADMAYVWVYKNTIWFIQKESLDAWYLPVDQIGGTAVKLPLGAEFGQGGSLLVGQSWSLATSAQGGLSDQNVFVSTEGEVVVFQGSRPDDASSWAKVGNYRMGSPLGRRAFIRAGGDLVFATTIGFVALSTVVQVDTAALAPRAVSYAIEDAWNAAVAQRDNSGWVCCLWPESQMVAVAPPTSGSSPLFLVSNARTGAWAPFTNWDAICMEVFEGRLFFGTPDGYVMEAMVGGTDRGIPFTGTYMPLFTDAGKPSAMKVARIARSEIMSATVVNEKLSCRFDFDETLPPAPDVEPVPVGNEWDNAIWNEAVWGSERLTIITKRRHSVGGNGYRLSPVLQITSGAAVPLDAKIVSVDVAYETGDIFT